MFSTIASIIAAIGIIQGILTVFLGLLQGNWSISVAAVSHDRAIRVGAASIVAGAFAILQAVIAAGLTLITTIWSTSCGTGSCRSPRRILDRDHD
ncbi:hypothetical protein QJS66_02475 [Kocuria rhizophila]|nr:hypothetical protein QJS66_02475 [Kocuria rhizophila]